MSQNNTDSTLDSNRFLIFHVGEQVFGTPLLDVREVVEYQNPKIIPNTKPHFSGVINLRGEIVGVIDLRLRFNTKSSFSNGVAMMVFETDVGPLAAIVDKVDSVIELHSNDIEQKTAIANSAPVEYILGIGKIENTLITLIQLGKILGIEELSSLKK